MPPILNIIHLETRLDRLQSFMEQMQIQAIRYNVWAGVTEHENPIVNINRAHKNIIRDAKEKNLPRIHVCEDDVLFTAPGAWKYYFQKMPPMFDFYCGLIYYGKFSEHDGKIEVAKSGILTLYTVHQKFYDDFLSTDETINLDRSIGLFAKNRELYTCFPFVAKQISGGFSDHFKRVQDYQYHEVDKKFLGDEVL